LAPCTCNSLNQTPLHQSLQGGRSQVEKCVLSKESAIPLMGIWPYLISRMTGLLLSNRLILLYSVENLLSCTLSSASFRDHSCQVAYRLHPLSSGAYQESPCSNALSIKSAHILSFQEGQLFCVCPSRIFIQKLSLLPFQFID